MRCHSEAQHSSAFLTTPVRPSIPNWSAMSSVCSSVFIRPTPYIGNFPPQKRSLHDGKLLIDLRGLKDLLGLLQLLQFAFFFFQLVAEVVHSVFLLRDLLQH